MSSEPYDSAGTAWSSQSLLSLRKSQRVRNRKDLVAGLVLGVEGQNQSVLCNFLARAELASFQNRTVLMGRAGAL